MIPNIAPENQLDLLGGGRGGGLKGCGSLVVLVKRDTEEIWLQNQMEMQHVWLNPAESG